MSGVIWTWRSVTGGRCGGCPAGQTTAQATPSPRPAVPAGSERYQSREQGRGQQAHVTYLTAKQAIGLSRGRRQNRWQTRLAWPAARAAEKAPGAIVVNNIGQVAGGGRASRPS